MCRLLGGCLVVRFDLGCVVFVVCGGAEWRGMWMIVRTGHFGGSELRRRTLN